MRRILFGSRFDWQPAIQARLDPRRYSAAFSTLQDAGLEDHDGVVPLRFEDYDVLRRRASGQDRPAHHRYLFPDAETVSLCNDKLRLNRFLIDAGLGDIVPDLYPDAASARRPYILKQTDDECGRFTFLVDDPADEADCIAQVCGTPFFRQQAIPGNTEWATHFLAREGRILFATHVRYGMPAELAIKGQKAGTTDITLVPDLPFDRRLAQAVGTLRYSGTGCVDYKMADGVPKLFEINPRPGWSLQFDINRYLDRYLDVVGMR